MALVKFKYYVHDDYTRSEFAAFLLDQVGEELEQAGIKNAEAVVELVGNPFGEISLDCELDTTTGEVRLTGAKL